MSTWLVVWGIWHVYFVEAVFPNAILWLHYYAASYEFGFVRRGLGGELIRMLTGDHFFAGAYTVLWTSITVWLIALAVVVWLILSTGNRSERRIMLALLVPVLPFAFSYAIYNPHPELFGMTALVAFSIFLTRAHTSRTRVILSTLDTVHGFGGVADGGSRHVFGAYGVNMNNSFPQAGVSSHSGRDCRTWASIWASRSTSLIS